MRFFPLEAKAYSLVCSILLLVSALLWFSSSFAQGGSTNTDAQSRPVKVGILSAPPFVFKNELGQWDGLSVVLWNRITESHKIDYEFVELATPVQALDGIRSKELLTVVSGVNITADREKYGSFSTPFYVTDESAAVSARDRSVYTNMVGYLTSKESLIYIAALIGLIVLHATVFFVLEGRQNTAICEPGQPDRRNIAQSTLWSIMLATGQDPNLHKSKTLVVRFVSMLLFFVGLFTFSAFVAILSSSLTVSKLATTDFQSLDLHEKRVGVIRGSRSAEYCRHQFIVCETFDNLPQGLTLLNEGKLDVVLGQKVELHTEASRMKIPLDYVNVPDRRSYYAFLFSDNFKKMDDFNLELMKIVDSPAYPDLVRRYIRLD